MSRASARRWSKKTFAKVAGSVGLNSSGIRPGHLPPLPTRLHMHRLGLRLTSASVRASASSSAPRFKSRWGTRRLHQRQPLPYSEEEGLGRFLPPEALKVQLEYQDGLLERLNEQVVGMCSCSLSLSVHIR